VRPKRQWFGRPAFSTLALLALPPGGGAAARRRGGAAGHI